MHSVGRLAAAATLLFSWAAAAAPTVSYDFEGLPIPTETPFTVTASGLTATFAGPADVDPGAFGITSNFLTSTGYQYRLMTGDFLTIGSAFGASGSALTITFSAPVSGLSFDFALDDPDSVSVLTVSTASGFTSSIAASLTPGFLYPEASYAFDASPFTRMTIASNAIDFQLDNLRVTTAQRVPEPATTALLVVGLGALVRRRRGATRSASHRLAFTQEI